MQREGGGALVRVVAEGLLDLLAGGEEADEEEGRDGDAGDGPDAEGLDELEGQGEQVKPDGAVVHIVSE